MGAVQALPDVHPMRSLGLLSVAHAVNHAFAVLLPLIFLEIIDEFGVGVETVAFLAAAGALAVRDGPAVVRGADPARLATPAAGRRRPAVRGRVRGPGPGRQLPDLRRAQHRGPHRWLAAAPGRQRAAGRAVPASIVAASPSAPTSRAATWARSWSRSSARRSSCSSGWRGASLVFGLAAAGHRPGRPGPHPRARHRPGRGPGRRQLARCAARGAQATATCAGCS